MVNFGGWHMPLSYGSQIEEHHSVRKSCGIFDISHMGIIDLVGTKTKEFLRILLANDINKLDSSDNSFHALYSCMLNTEGGILDDLIIYRLREDYYRLVLNAGTFTKDLKWIKDNIFYGIDLNIRKDLSMIAIQGPDAEMQLGNYLNCISELNYLNSFTAIEREGIFISRTGYTGEDGFEIILSNDSAMKMWNSFNKHGVRCCGLGSRDTLRLEAGLNLYGQYMDETVNPFESALDWTLDFNSHRNFIGKEALERKLKIGISQKLVGAVLEGKGVLRSGYTVYTDEGEGKITSGSFSPSIGCSIGFARVPKKSSRKGQVNIRGEKKNIFFVKPPFVRDGKIKLDIKGLFY